MQSYYIGCAGWSVPRSEEQKAAAKVSGESHLTEYSKIFNCVEINSSFYRHHKPDTYRKWANSVAEHFRFSAKLPRAITHHGFESIHDLTIFLDGVLCLGPKLGVVLIQTPGKAVFTETVLTKVLSQMRQRYSGTIVCEPRHSSWFSPEAQALFKRFEVSYVHADPVPVPAAHLLDFYPISYLRLHGSPRMYYSRYDQKSLRTFSERFQISLPSSPPWCIFDNTAEGAAFVNARTFSTMIFENSSNADLVQPRQQAS